MPDGPVSIIFVCGPPEDTCFFCGEWLHVETPGGYPGPHDNRYCTEDCCAEIEAAERRSKLPTRITGCPSCGLDNFEHADDCEATHATPA